MQLRSHRVIALASLALIFVLLGAGHYITRAAIDDGRDAFASHPQESAVAQSAVTVVRHVRGHPVVRFVLPAVQVVEVRRAPGNCVQYPTDADIPNLEYEASVRLYTFFAIPVGTHRSTCGGWAA